MPSIPSIYFPDEFVTFPAVRGRIDKTISVEAQGRRQRRPEWPVGGKRYLRGQVTPLGRANWQVLRDFHQARQGTYDNFFIFAANVETYVEYVLGTGFTSYPVTVPFKARSGVAHASALYKNSSVNLNATFDSGGAGGELRATTGDAIIAGDTLKVSTTARERIIVCFATDKFDWEVLASGEEWVVPTVDVLEDL